MKRHRLGDILLSMGAIDNLQLQAALSHQQQWGTSLGRAVVEQRFCNAKTVLDALSRQTGMAKVDLDQEQLDPKLAAVVTRKVALQHRLVPLRLDGEREEVLVVAIAAPASLAGLDAARAVSGKSRVIGVLASDGAVDRALARLYGNPFETLATTQPMRFDEIERALAARRTAPKDRPVLLFGWPELTAQHLTSQLEKHSVNARPVTAAELTGLDEGDVVVAPIPMIEALKRIGHSVTYRLIATGNTPDFDLPRAHRLGAKSFLLAPVDVQLLLRAIRRCHADAPPRGLEAYGAA